MANDGLTTTATTVCLRFIDIIIVGLNEVSVYSVVRTEPGPCFT